jgi:hypothetical protein
MTPSVTINDKLPPSDLGLGRHDCCECWDCLLAAIKLQESRGEGLPPGTDNQDHRGCNSVATDGDKCGPYQIGNGYWEEAKKACKVKGAGACCELKNTCKHSKQCEKCTGTPAQISACCD